MGYVIKAPIVLIIFQSPLPSLVIANKYMSQSSEVCIDNENDRGSNMADKPNL